VTRKILAVIAAIVAGALAITLVEMVAHQFVPPGPVDPRSHLPLDPPTVPMMLTVIVGWAVGALVGGWVATRLGRASYGPALIAGLVLMGAGLMMVIAIPSPVWFWILGLGQFVPMALLGFRVARP
jgi:MFS family permease